MGELPNTGLILVCRIVGQLGQLRQLLIQRGREDELLGSLLLHSLPPRLPPALALFDMPNLNRFDILSISIFCKIALSISISLSIFSKITISISISISIFLELPYRYRYRYRYFSELPYRYRYRYRYFQHLHIDIDIDIDIFQKCRYIDNQYFLSIF